MSRDLSHEPVTGSELLVLTKWQLVQMIKRLGEKCETVELRRILQEAREAVPPYMTTKR